MENIVHKKENFGERLKRMRIEKGFTQVQLGKLSGISNVQIARYEKSKTKPTATAIKKLSDTLQIKYEELAGVFFSSKLDLNELDATFQDLKKLPQEDIIVMKEVLDSYIWFKKVKYLNMHECLIK